MALKHHLTAAALTVMPGYAACRTRPQGEGYQPSSMAEPSLPPCLACPRGTSKLEERRPSHPSPGKGMATTSSKL